MTNHKYKKRGMPEGHLLYPKEIILNKLSGEFKTTNDILNEINIETSMRDMSWNTVHKYLGLLVQDKKVESRRVGSYNLWRLAKKEVEISGRKRDT